MAREKFSTLTEQMYYILLLMQTECCGTDVMENVQKITNGRVKIGAGTMYTLLESFVTGGYIRETKVEGRKRSYIITPAGRDALKKERTRLNHLISDWNAHYKEETAHDQEDHLAQQPVF